MESQSAQQLFFLHLKGKLPDNISFVDEIAGFLNISNDSAYRRIRGEKSIAFDELQKLCTHYRISLDSFLHLQSDCFIFRGKMKSNAENGFEEWLENLVTQLQIFNNHKQKHMYVLMKDIPPYVHFMIPELMKFKSYFWMKSVFDYKILKGVKFDLEDPRYDKFDVLAKKIGDLYIKIPTTEIWNIESIESSLRQINFYRETGSFKNPSDVNLLYSKFEELINHIEKQAEHGFKFPIGREPAATSSEYWVYLNELILGDNSVIAELDGLKMTFLNCGVMFIVHSRDEFFNNSMRENFDNLMKKSMLISKTGENERVKFFNQVRERIDHYRDFI